ncbi:hypothetical protein L1987_05559 [Smallanthus sonchifolius]|uniref:Uncharacterized protein n=1 Tax=Smallanthus sonchifolius TaxID=185202 RepID=A0ACB9JVX6_9ASTR|nr:hypothetical protein L1987_05559 [Smallanthus sonchifolius]
MPIFYDIDPSDVRKLNGKFGETLAKHESEHKHKVESWRRALVKSSNLSGWVPKDFANGHEAKCIKDIVGKISGRVIKNVNKVLIGIETRLQDLKSKLKIGYGGVRMVGIWGVGGGGKTTLASAAYTEISHQFEAHCLFENIRDESSKHGLKKLQEKFLSLTLKTNVVVESEIEGRSMIERRLCRKSVLVVLDDVDDPEQIEALAGSHDWFEMAHYIVRGEHPNNPEKHSRIWKKEDIVEFCAMEGGTLMENEVLVLPSYVKHPRLPHVVANMKKLRWIDWDMYPASSFPSNFQPRKLGCLMLIRGEQKELWKGCKHLPNLKILDLRHSKKFPPIIRMKKLEILKLSSCYQLQKFPDIQSNMDSLRNAVEHRFMSVILPGERKDIVSPTTTFITLQLPANWHSDFTGFLLCVDNYMWNDECVIVIKQDMGMESQPDDDHNHWEEFDKNPESCEHTQVGYIPFGSLRHTSWWNPTYTNTTFQIQGKGNCKVGLVPRKERPKATMIEFWDEVDEYRKTFEVIDDSKSSSIRIGWCL